MVEALAEPFPNLIGDLKVLGQPRGTFTQLRLAPRHLCTCSADDGASPDGPPGHARGCTRLRQECPRLSPFHPKTDPFLTFFHIILGVFA